MAVIYAAALRTARMNEVVDAIDAGSGAGKLKIYTTGLGSLLATITLAEPCGSVSGDVLTFDFDPDISTTGAADGTAAAATITDSDDNVIVSGLTVGTSGTNVVLDNTSIATSQTVTITAGTLTHNTSGT
jgi:hypothetical protein